MASSLLASFLSLDSFKAIDDFKMHVSDINPIFVG